VATILLILHGLVAVALLGAITHQTLAACAAPTTKPLSFFGRFRAVPGAVFTNAVVVLYAVSWLLDTIVYLYFKIDVQPNLERDRHWHALGYLDLKEDFVAIGLGLLPPYWFCWRRPVDGQNALILAAVTILLAFIIWWSFLVGRVVNNIGGFGW
jgi:hypothetical protein